MTAAIHPPLFALDSSSGNIINRYHLKQITNIDWEAITQNDSFIFIENFGNNLGNRKSDLLHGSQDSIPNKLIHLHYPEQQNFSPVTGIRPGTQKHFLA